jgi:hypothetical protein
LTNCEGREKQIILDERATVFGRAAISRSDAPPTDKARAEDGCTLCVVACATSSDMRSLPAAAGSEK